MIHDGTEPQGRGIESGLHANTDTESDYERATVVAVVELKDPSSKTVRCKAIGRPVCIVFLVITAVLGIYLHCRSAPVLPLTVTEPRVDFSVPEADQPEIPHIRNVLVRMSEKDNRAELCIRFFDRVTECRKAPGRISFEDMRLSEEEQGILLEDGWFFAYDKPEESELSTEEQNALAFFIRFHSFLEGSHPSHSIGTDKTYKTEQVRSEHHTRCLNIAKMQIWRMGQHNEFYQDFDLYHKIACGKADPVLTYPQLQRLRMLQEKCLLINNPAGHPTPLDIMDIDWKFIGTDVPRPEGTMLRHFLHEALFWIEELVTCPDPAAPWNQ